MFDWLSDAWDSISDYFSNGGGDALATEDAVNLAELEAGDSGNFGGAGDTGGGGGSFLDQAGGVYKDIASDPAGKVVLQQGAMAGVNALQGRSAAKQQQAFNDQLSQMIRQSNMSASQAVPIRETGLSGSRGIAMDPSGTAAGMSRTAPVAPSANVSGTQAAPAVPVARSQTGAVKLGVRPRQYA
jgi:hypothetical protein